ncbi:MAG: hypothetical protein L3J86_03600 [Thermoplasmata archaeon]|nr:hypothetical protein [Thermoplasmata archaeon]
MSYVDSGYVDAGYGVGLSVLFLYALSLVARRRRLERSVELAPGEDPAAPDQASGP